LRVTTQLAIVGALCAVAHSRALIFIGTKSLDDNTTAPTGIFANSGFELQGTWSVFQGTPIGPHHFITAKHVGGLPGQAITLNAVAYTAVAAFPDSVSDLQIWEVNGTFPQFAQLYDGPNETFADLIVLGRGALKGGPVTVDGELKGWIWGEWDHRLRWGHNIVSALQNDNGQPPDDEPHFIQADFDADATDDEAHLAVGDSGGGVFIQQDGVWRLAGINAGVDGPFNTMPSGAGFNAALFDIGGLYYAISATQWKFAPDLPLDQPSSFYATRIKSRLSWIQSVLATPVLVGASDLAGPYTVEAAATVDATAKTISIPVASGNQFFRLDSTSPLTIVGTQINGSTLVIEYQ
jgi:hypothetical protein